MQLYRGPHGKCIGMGMSTGESTSPSTPLVGWIVGVMDNERTQDDERAMSPPPPPPPHFTQGGISFLLLII